MLAWLNQFSKNLPVYDLKVNYVRRKLVKISAWYKVNLVKSQLSKKICTLSANDHIFSLSDKGHRIWHQKNKLLGPKRNAVEENL